MWFMLITSVIIAGISIARMLPADRYDPAAIAQACYAVAGLALLIGLAALIRLEPRTQHAAPVARRSYTAMLAMIRQTPQARLFFVYLILLLIAILGQDVLLEPYAADIFQVPIAETTRYTSIWGGALLLGLLVTSSIVQRWGKAGAATLGAVLVGFGLILIACSGLVHLRSMLMPSLLLFGFGSGISTAANLALMLDMTLPGQIGVFVGAWGMADALARLLGTLLSGVVRDGVIMLAGGEKLLGYVVVFLLQALAMFVSLLLLRRLNVDRFRQQAAPTTGELVALAGETSGG
jgi:BCD family chlorophyll transporter-like MFS transporter